MFVHVKSINKFTLEKFGKKQFSFYFISFYSLVTLQIIGNYEFTPNLLRSSLGPTPDSKSKCGDITAPADTIISLLILTVCSCPSRINCTPTAFLSSNSI